MDEVSGYDATSRAAGQGLGTKPSFHAIGRDGSVAEAVAAVTTPGRRGLVLVAPPGAGKTFVLGCAADILTAQQVPIIRVRGDATLASIPFGAFRDLLPTVSASPDGWAELVRSGIDRLTADPPEPATVVVVDDIQHLDAGSAAILLQGLAAGRFKALGAVRSGAFVSDAVARLWVDGLLDRVELRPLERTAAAELAVQLVGGPLEGASEQRLWRWTQGNPLFLRELIASAQAAGGLQPVRGLWRIRGQVAGSDGLRTLLAHRLAGCPAGVREVADTLAVTDRLPAAVLEAIAGTEAVGEAEQSRVIMVHDDDRLECRLAHPLHGEVLRHELGADQIRARQERLIDAVTSLGLDAAGDRMLLAVWHLETERSGPDTVELLTEAARSAWMANDSVLASRLARRAWELGRDPATGLLLCESLSRVGLAKEMTAVAQDLLLNVDDDGVRAEAVAYLAMYKRVWTNRPEEAIELAEAWTKIIADPVHRANLELIIATTELDRGRPARAAEILTEVLEGATPTVANAATLILVPALAGMGQLDEAIRVADRAIAAAIGSEGQLLNDLGGHLLFRVDSGSMQGDLGTAVGMLEGSYEQVATAGDAMALAWLTFVLGRVEARRGRARSGLSWFRESAAAFAEMHRPGWEAWSHAGTAQCWSLLGELDEAAIARARVEALGPWRIGFGDPDVRRALAWVRVAEGRLDDARAELWAALLTAEEHCERFNMASILNDLIRLGDLDAAPRLEALSQRVASPLIAAWSARATALQQGCDDGMAGAVAQLLHEGAVLDAAEAESARATFASHLGDDRAATAAVHRAAALLAECEGASTPGVAALTRPELSRRELDVARLAAAGQTRRDIAAALFLSVRTVDSHLQRIYRKLGVTNSGALAAVLPEVVPG